MLKFWQMKSDFISRFIRANQCRWKLLLFVIKSMWDLDALIPQHINYGARFDAILSGFSDIVKTCVDSSNDVALHKNVPFTAWCNGATVYWWFPPKHLKFFTFYGKFQVNRKSWTTFKCLQLGMKKRQEQLTGRQYRQSERCRHFRFTTLPGDRKFIHVKP